MLMRCSIPLNLISLESDFLNNSIIKILDELRAQIVNHFKDENYGINRGFVFDII